MVLAVNEDCKFLSILRMFADSKAIGHIEKIAFCEMPYSITATKFDKRIISKSDSKIDFRVPMQSV